MTDATLLQKALKGDPSAFRTIYDRHAGGVYAYALRMIGTRETAEDVTQEVFMSMLRRGVGYDASRPFRPWLLGIARNAAIDALRQGARRSEVHQASGRPEGALDRPAGIETTEVVEQELAQLPPTFREAVWLCDGMGLPYEEAAAVMNCDVGTVGSRVARGRNLLRERFAKGSHAV